MGWSSLSEAAAVGALALIAAAGWAALAAVLVLSLWAVFLIGGAARYLLARRRRD